MLGPYKLRSFSNLSNLSNFSNSPNRSPGQSQGQGQYRKLAKESRAILLSSIDTENKQPVNQPATKMSASDEMTEYWKCCEVSDISEKVCAKRNYIEVSTCERCGHWQCDTCTLTTDPNAPPKDYPKPKDPEDTLKHRASVSLQRASSIMIRNDLNAKGKEKETIREVPIAEGSEKEHSVTLVDNGNNGNNLVRRASVSLKRAGTMLARKRQSLAGTSKLDGQAGTGSVDEMQTVNAKEDTKN